MINDNMRSKLRQLARRLEEIDGMLADPACASDMSKFRALTKERADIEPVVKKHLELESVDMDISTAQGMLEDPEMKAFAQEEILEAQKKLEVIEHELQILLLPKDPNDSRNIFLEIRAATRRSLSASSARAPIPSSSSSPAVTACSACLQPKVRGASTRPHAPSPFCPSLMKSAK